VKLESLESLKDDELQGVIAKATALLAQRDRQRKDEALEKVRVILASAGLPFSAVAGKGYKNGNGGPKYHGGHQYQHPTNKALVYGGRGKKPAWLRDLELQGGKALEVA
jgi:hypothetical protein